MKTVAAYRDNGPMSAVSRWKPRRVYCTETANPPEGAGVEYVVKFRQGNAGTAALISEVVCGHLLQVGGVPGLERCLVQASKEFAASCKTKKEIPYLVEPGVHFGTVWRPDLQAGPPVRIEDLADPQELLDLWAFDCWFCTTDRSVYGNILLAHVGGGRFHLVAADQSDGFGGAVALADGTWKKRLGKLTPAESLDFLDRAIYDRGGVAGLRQSLEKVRQAGSKLQEAINAVPGAWWQEADVRPAELQDALECRLRELERILELKKWEGLDHDTRGGHLL